MNIPVNLKHESWIRFHLKRLDFCLAIVLAFLALALRWPFIVRGNTLLMPDEAIVGIMAQDIAEGRHFPIYFYGQSYMGTLEAYTMAGLRLLINDPFLPLRLAPALYFSLLVGIFFLMLTRWFGRVSGLAGSLALIFASPMFVQWSISGCCGGYIEVILWGVLFWWAYSEWFIQPRIEKIQYTKQVFFGLLIGSGLWLNPMFIVFLLPVIVHAFLGQLIHHIRYQTRWGVLLQRIEKRYHGWPIVLPTIILGGVLLSNFLCVEKDGQTLILFNLFPRKISLILLGSLLGAVIFYLFFRKKFYRWVMDIIHLYKPMFLGFLLGYLPSMIYVIYRIISGKQMEGQPAFWFRAIWTIDSTLSFLWAGLPVILGADPDKYINLVQQGRMSNTNQLSTTLHGFLFVLNIMIFFSLAIIVLLLIVYHRNELIQMLRLHSARYGPSSFLLLAVTIHIGLFIFSSTAFNFTTIRYMLPSCLTMTAILSASLAVKEKKLRVLTGLMIIILMSSWSVGQVAFWLQLGRPHPLEPVATALQNHRVRIAGAEILDAHILSFLTQQNPKIFEYRPFWPRLSHYLAEIEPNRPIPYIVNTDERDWISAWIDTKFPGPPPVDNQHYLYTELRQLHNDEPHKILLKEKLYGTWELWLLDRPLRIDVHSR